ncbi:hypothetical protein NB559_21815 [Vibrio parahaemolyticus]|uniref:Uncharacterized protein n=1 Tax=Vibrio parahaemolyticus TaxID=670 RepID=A0A9Q3UBU5_VIBPH|nr:hypothetical protein [Vibrio parahaemolyticus]MCC3805102.1 hypothetical protein [Vibrio parahaemolyticus]MCR9652482.1 hypothetical protein [Vibrio parahaemolyticus]CAH1572139.1 conserved hypothetical protein [Vibrio harveyi]
MRNKKKQIVLRGQQDNQKLEEITKFHVQRNLKLAECVLNTEKRLFINMTFDTIRQVQKILNFINTYYNHNVNDLKSIFNKVVLHYCDLSEYKDSLLSDFSKSNNKKFIEFSDLEKRVFDFEKKELENEKGRLSNLDFLHLFITKKTRTVDFKKTGSFKKAEKLSNRFSRIADKNRNKIVIKVSQNKTNFDHELVKAIKSSSKLKAHFETFNFEEFKNDFINYCESLLKQKNQTSDLSIQQVEIE